MKSVSGQPGPSWAGACRRHTPSCRVLGPAPSSRPGGVRSKEQGGGARTPANTTGHSQPRGLVPPGATGQEGPCSSPKPPEAGASVDHRCPRAAPRTCAQTPSGADLPGPRAAASERILEIRDSRSRRGPCREMRAAGSREHFRKLSTVAHLGPRGRWPGGPSVETTGLCTVQPRLTLCLSGMRRVPRPCRLPRALPSLGYGPTPRGAPPTGRGVLETIRRRAPAQGGDAAAGRVPEPQQQGAVPSPDSLWPQAEARTLSELGHALRKQFTQEQYVTRLLFQTTFPITVRVSQE